MYIQLQAFPEAHRLRKGFLNDQHFLFLVWCEIEGIRHRLELSLSENGLHAQKDQISGRSSTLTQNIPITQSEEFLGEYLEMTKPEILDVQLWFWNRHMGTPPEVEAVLGNDPTRFIRNYLESARSCDAEAKCEYRPELQELEIVLTPTSDALMQSLELTMLTAGRKVVRPCGVSRAFKVYGESDANKLRDWFLGL